MIDVSQCPQQLKNPYSVSPAPIPAPVVAVTSNTPAAPSFQATTSGRLSPKIIGDAYSAQFHLDANSNSFFPIYVSHPGTHFQPTIPLHHNCPEQNLSGSATQALSNHNAPGNNHRVSNFTQSDAPFQN